MKESLGSCLEARLAAPLAASQGARYNRSVSQRFVPFSPACSPWAVTVALVILLSSAVRSDGSIGGSPGGGNLSAADLTEHLAAGRSVTVWAGGDNSQGDDGAIELADFRFQPERGYGYVGGRTESLSEGRTGSLPGSRTLGGDSAWPAAWRDGIERYSLRVPRGRYLVELLLL